MLAATETGCRNGPGGLKSGIEGQHVSNAVRLRLLRTEVTLVVHNLVIVSSEIAMVTRDGL